MSSIPVVTVSAVDGGHLTLPERLFVTDADPQKRSTVPSLTFLIQHPSSPPGRPGTVTNILFDLGVKRDIDAYTPSQREHISQREPVGADPDCAENLRRGSAQISGSAAAVNPETDVDLVVLSHVHWDHVGTPSDFAAAIFLVGAGTLHLLRHGAGRLYPADLFNDDELPASRTVELPAVARTAASTSDEYDEPPRTEAAATATALLPAAASQWSWQALGALPHVLDVFGDGSLYIVDSPGHLYGHVNVLARVGPHRYVYLGGDCCHDPRILSGERGIAEYDDGHGGVRSVHVHTQTARETLDQTAAFLKQKHLGNVGQERVEDSGPDITIEAVVAHDGDWAAKNRHRFWPQHL